MNQKILLFFVVTLLFSSGCIDNIQESVTENKRENCYSDHPNEEVQGWKISTSHLENRENNWTNETNEPLFYFVMEQGCDHDRSDVVFKFGETGAKTRCEECFLEDNLLWGVTYTFTEGELIKCEERGKHYHEIDVYSVKNGIRIDRMGMTICE